MVKVKVTSKIHVKPSKMIGRRECQLLTFDLPYLTFYYNQKLLIYKVDNGDLKAMVEKLKDGLRVVLEEFYQLAGRLGQDEEGVFRLEYDDEMDGVEVADEIGIDDLTFDKGTNTLKELIPYNGVFNLEGLHRPLLAVQLTKLKDGLAIGCAFNHSILDGTSTWHFISSWAEICSGAPSISVRPFLERTKARNTQVKLNFSLPLHPHAKQEPQPLLREKIFNFSEAAIDQIKSKLNSKPKSDGSKPFSTFQSLAVHIWRHVSRACNLKPQEYTVFTIFANCRKRVDPPMPDSYFGNLIQTIFTVSAAGLLLEKPPEFCASMIQNSIEMHNAKAIDELNKKWESAPKIFQFKDAGVNCVAVGSSPRFKVYDVDFGWGKAESVRSGSNNRFDGMVYLYQGKSGGRSIDVDITLEASVMERLEMDEEFHMDRGSEKSLEAY